MLPPKITDAQRADIVALHGGPETAASIGQRYGLSRGYVTRIWFDARRPAVAAPLRLVVSPPIANEPILPGLPPPDAVVEPDALTDDGKTFAELGDNDCRWTIGHDADGHFRFCGCPRHRPTWYCSPHASQSWTPAYEQVAA